MPELGLGNRLNSESSTSSGIVRGSDYWVAMDGDSDYISLSSSFNTYLAAKDWSLSAWIYHSGNSGTIFSAGNISSGNAFRWKMESDKLYYYFGTTGTSISGTAASALTDNTWYHVGITHDDSAETIKFYVNGSVTDTFTSQNVPGVVHATNARIGALAELGSSTELTGKIANVAIFSDLVTAGEMTNLASVHSYDATSIGNCVGWWRMGAGTEAGSGTTIYDMSSNSNNGTLTGGTIEQGTIS